MPAQQLIRDPNPLRTIRLEVDDLTLDLVDGCRITLHMVFDSGTRATVVSRVLTGDALADFPTTLQALGDAFLWGDGPNAVLAWAQKLDRTAQSRRARASVTGLD